jgi:hypothetical protein
MFYLTFFDRPAPNYDSDCNYTGTGKGCVRRGLLVLLMSSM